ncbi:hypothetical protein ACIBH1_18805 [Nonomuraea sp. NPDC050663]|uniref:hypothetical protein n=1 Tax=Nonomuraea sp. NPDC050663 TaxID=3364370 RepID=UPI0037B85E63
MTEEEPAPEWCIVGTLMPYPYSANSPVAHHRSQKIFPAGAKLYVVGGFAGMAHETVTVIGYPHGRRAPVMAHIAARYIGGWRAQLVYRPVILRAIRDAADDDSTAHRWLTSYENKEEGRYEPAEAAYGEHLAKVAAHFQRSLHGGGAPG